jgi:hypothetical protein
MALDSFVEPQPAPTEGSGTPIADLVIGDLVIRKNMGIKKYGVPLRARNGRNTLIDAYQEALDLCLYLRQAIMEQNHAD